MFRSFTGLDVPEFDPVYFRVKTKYDERERQRLAM